MLRIQMEKVQLVGDEIDEWDRFIQLCVSLFPKYRGLNGNTQR